jgi:molybdopterin biosynthesis enzyme
VRLRRQADGSTSARLTGAQGSGLATSMARADGLAIVPADTALRPGDRVRVVVPGGAPLVEEAPF